VRLWADLRALWPLRDYRRLLGVRVTGQLADGMVQVGLATVFFFSPQNASSAAGVATAFAVLLLPFTLVGPWAGVFLDRWRRRQVLVVGNLVRVATTLATAAAMAAWGVGPSVYVLALVTLSLNRFLLAALSASLPRVVDDDLLLTANAVTPTLGTVAAFVGSGLGFVVGRLLPAGTGRDALALLVAAGVMAGAAALALRLGRDRLGPDEPVRTPLRGAVAAVARDLVAGARHLRERRTPAAALGAMTWSRLCYSMVFVASILLSRNLLADPGDPDAGLATFALVVGVSAVGFAAAMVLTPVVARRIGAPAWIVVCLLLGAATQVLLVATVARPAVLAAAAALGLSTQGVKIAADTIVQRDTADEFRGRAFAVYDVLYNGANVVAAAIAALVLPDDGWSRAVMAALAVAYVGGAMAYRRTSGRIVPETARRTVAG
jgi:MFS family permease